MISKVRIRNFQSHKSSDVEFVNGVNIIIGSSDSGKSAIIRAINWIINNKPSGEEFKSFWGGDTFAEMEIEGQKIIRKKTKKDNSYFLNESEYKAFGQDVPDEIKLICNFSDVNLQSQLDSPFILGLTAGETAKYLNKVINLDIIDKSLSNIQRMKRSASSSLESVEIQMKKLRDESKAFLNLSDIEEMVIKGETLEKETLSIKKDILKITELIDIHNKIIYNLSGYENLSEKEKFVTLAIEKEKELKEIRIAIEKMNLISSQIKGIESRVSEFSIIEKGPLVDTALEKEKELKEALSFKNKMILFKDSFLIHLKKIEDQSGEIARTEKIYLDSMPDICPLCNQEIRK